MTDAESTIEQIRSLLSKSDFLKITALFVAYFSTAYFGLKIAPVNQFATLVWAPTGISLAAIFLFGYKLWPAIFLGAVSVNFLTGAPLPIALAIGVGNTLEACFGTYLLKKARFEPSLTKVENVLKLIILAAIVSTMVSATVGVASLWFGGKVGAGELSATWSAWWVGDALGALIIAPLIFTWWSARYKLAPNGSLPELFFWYLSLIIISFFVFTRFFDESLRNSQIAYLVLPPLFWGAIRFKQPQLTAATVTLALIAIFGTTQGLGPFAREDTSSGLFHLQLFLAVVAITLLIVTAAIAEAKVSEERVLDLNKKLQNNVRDLERLNNIMAQQVKQSSARDSKPKPQTIER